MNLSIDGSLVNEEENMFTALIEEEEKEDAFETINTKRAYLINLNQLPFFKSNERLD